MTWILYALLSAFFTALVTIFSKAYLDCVDPMVGAFMLSIIITVGLMINKLLVPIKFIVIIIRPKL